MEQSGILKVHFVLLSLLLTMGCSDNDMVFDLDYPQELINSWTASYEEGEGVYRLSDSRTFPPARFRQIYQFMEDYQCKVLYIGPADGHLKEDRIWGYDKKEKVIRVYTIDGDFEFSLKIIDVSEDRLLLDRQ